MTNLGSMRRWLLLAIAIAALGGCASSFQPQAIRPGQSEAEVLQRMGGPPTGRYPGPNGQTRLEYATGPYGRVTWMVDLDASGRVIEARQVLEEWNFIWFQQNAGGRDATWVRYQLGRPSEVLPLGWLGGQLWAYRYPTYECLWFVVTVNKDGSLRDVGSYGTDPRCDPGSFDGGGSRR